MAWETPAGDDEWGTGDVNGGGEWDTTADKPAADAFDDGAEAENGYGGGEESGGGFSGGCFNCGEEGYSSKSSCSFCPPYFANSLLTSHGKAGCPNLPKPRPCFNCGEEGHTKAECTNAAVPREFTGTCRLCDEQGHRASDCPTAPPKHCNNCKEEGKRLSSPLETCTEADSDPGHSILECKNPRKIERNDVEDVEAEVAWAALIKQSEEGDYDDMKEEAMKYIKASPDATYVQLEKAFRAQNIPLYLIAIEKELAKTYTNMDLQGNLDRKYTVSWRKSPKHTRPKEKDSWPPTPEENLERLADAGEAVDRGIPLCSRCSELGHIWKHCSQEAGENNRVVVQCFNCNEM